MKVIIAGSRTITSPAVVFEGIRLGLVQFGRGAAGLTEVVSGRAPGVDRCGEHWARANAVPVVGFPADWAHYGSSAGVLRNKQMADYADALIAIWDGVSRGTLNMIAEMEKRAKPLFVHNVGERQGM